MYASQTESGGTINHIVTCAFPLGNGAPELYLCHVFICELCTIYSTAFTYAVSWMYFKTPYTALEHITATRALRTASK